MWGHYHGGNLGDELVVSILVDAIKSRLPDAQIVGISMSPEDTRRRHGIEAFPINPDRAVSPPSWIARFRMARALWTRARAVLMEAPFLVRSFRLLREIDLVVVAGSGQLLDEWNGPWLHPYTTYRWAVLARLAAAEMVYPSVGAGPIRHRLSAFFIRSALKRASFISVRDGASRRTLEAVGVRRSLAVCPDMGYAVPQEWLPRPVRGSAARSSLRVGLNVMAHQDPRHWPRGEARRYQSFVEKMAAFVSWLIAQEHEVCLFSSQTGADRRVADDVLALLSTRERESDRLRSALDDVSDVDDLLRIIASFDVVVAGRFHSVLVPLVLEIPVIGLAYNPKTSELLANAGYRERCLDIDTFTVASLVSTFEKVCATRGTAHPQHASRVAKHRAAVLGQFERLFGEGAPVDNDQRDL